MRASFTQWEDSSAGANLICMMSFDLRQFKTFNKEKYLQNSFWFVQWLSGDRSKNIH